MAKQPKTKGTREGAEKVISELRLKASEIKFTAETKADYYKRLLEDMDSGRLDPVTHVRRRSATFTTGVGR